jgi:LysR family transcriptional activator of mexEF-oprN operon
MMGIDHGNLAKLDLNLLVAFDALLSERSVTRAATLIGIGQSAMSHNLSRLRALFGDELLTRGPKGMRPTPRAMALIDPVRAALSQIEALTARENAFDPQTADRVFRIGLPDSVEVLLGPALLAHICETAPGVRLRLHTTVDSSQVLDDIDADRIDIAFGIGTFAEGQTHHKRRTLFTESYLCMFNSVRVGLTPPISLDNYVRLPHVLTSLRSGERGVVDDALAKLGLKRSIVLTTPRFLAVPFLVRGAPVVTTMHARLARYFAEALGLALSPPPLELPDISISILWHASYDRDPAHMWLRQTIGRLALKTAEVSGRPLSTRPP